MLNETELAALTSEIHKSLQTSYAAYSHLPRLFSDKKTPIANSFVNVALLKSDAVKQRDEDLAHLMHEPADTDQKIAWQNERLYSHEQFYKELQPIELDKLFSACSSKEKDPKRLVIWGRAGIGKSVLCQYLATQWAGINEQKQCD